MANNTDKIILGISIFNMLVVLLVAWNLYTQKETYEVVIPHADGGRKFEPPPDFPATIKNEMGKYVIDTKGKFNMDLDIMKIYLHKPGDEPMLKYYIKDNQPIQSGSLKHGTVADVYIMERKGCWKSKEARALPKDGQTLDMIMTYADCI
jgi:hypothetical protein